MAVLGMNDIRKGRVIVLDDEPYTVVAADFLRKQQRRPVMRTTLKSLRTGQTREHSFQQSDRVPEADVERVTAQFLYQESSQSVFMETQHYEQYEVATEALGDAAQWLLEGMEVELLLFEGAPVSVELPIKIDREVIEAPPGVRGDTSTNVMKEVVVAGPAKVKAPLFVAQGDVIRIDTRTGAYVERVSG